MLKDSRPFVTDPALSMDENLRFGDLVEAGYQLIEQSEDNCKDASMVNSALLEHVKMKATA